MSRLLAAALIAACAAPSSAAEAPFRGERCADCHSRIRDAVPASGLPSSELLPQAARRDVIVVGGGLGGLAAAWELRGLDVLVLEKEARAGGKVRRENWGRKRYPVAAGYMFELYLDELKGLFKELGIEGERIPKPTNNLRLQSPEVRAAVEKLVPDMTALSNKLGSIPPMPDASKDGDWLRELDGTSFGSYMESKYGPSAAEFADVYSRSLFGVGSSRLSALAGLVFFTADFGGGTNISWDGGPGIISEKLEEKLGRTVELGAFVLSVSTEAGGVRVEYEKDGRRQVVRGKAAVLATPSFVTRKLARGLPDWKLAALSKVRTSSYALAIVAMNETLYRDSFDIWSTSATIFTDLSPLDWGAKTQPVADEDTPAQLLEAYLPLGESEGRARLLSESDAQLSSRLLNDLERLFPGAKAKAHGVRILRWGHAMPVDFPGYLTGPRLDVAKPAEPFFFAGVDSELPCIEGALVSGLRAGREARRFLAR